MKPCRAALARSTNSWTASESVRSPEGGPEGTFVLAYAATPRDTPSASRSDIVVQRSTDGGVTWSDPTAINDDDPRNQHTSFYPQLDVAPNGRST